MPSWLIRKLCSYCSIEDVPTANRLDMVSKKAHEGGLDWNSLKPSFKKAVGCEKCARTGFKGRTVIAEMLEVTPEIAKALRSGASVEEMRRIAIGQGMTTMAADLGEIMHLRV